MSLQNLFRMRILMISKLRESPFTFNVENDISKINIGFKKFTEEMFTSFEANMKNVSSDKFQILKCGVLDSLSIDKDMQQRDLLTKIDSKYLKIKNDYFNNRVERAFPLRAEFIQKENYENKILTGLNVHFWPSLDVYEIHFYLTSKYKPYITINRDVQDPFASYSDCIFTKKYSDETADEIAKSVVKSYIKILPDNVQ